MKKFYIKPTTDTVNIQLPQMMAGSGDNNPNGNDNMDIVDGSTPPPVAWEPKFTRRNLWD